MTQSFDPDVRAEGYCGYIDGERDTPCGLVEGWGYENATTGFCQHHGERGGQLGNNNAVGNSGGAAPEGNQNHSTHGMYADTNNYYQDLDDEGRRFVDAHYESFLADAPFDNSAVGKCGVLFEISVNHHKRLAADGTIAAEGMSESKPVPAGDMALSDTKEHHLNLAYDRLARTDIRRLKELDVLDSPDSRQADATESVADLLGELNP